MPARLPALLALATLALLAGAWWAVRPDVPPPAAGQAADAARAGPAARLARALVAPSGPTAPAGCGPEEPADALAWDAPRPERLVVGAELTAGERVDELVADLGLLRPRSRSAGGEAGVVRRLEQFVIDVDVAGQREAAVAELLARFDAPPPPSAASPAAERAADEQATEHPAAEHQAAPRRARSRGAGEPSPAADGWLPARLLVALAGLGASAPVMARWPDLVPVERADVLVALGWDPLAPPDAPGLSTARADGLVRGVPLLPLALTRPPSPDVLAFLRERLADPTSGLHGLRVRDASLLVLGVGIGRADGCLEAVEACLREDPVGAFVALYTLELADDPGAAALLARLRRRHAGDHPVPADELATHERFALDLAHSLVAARGDALRDVPALCAGLLPGRDADARLDAAARVLARVSDGVPAIDARRSLSDALVGALAHERDGDVAWLELLALRQLHIGAAWLPSRTIGYGAEDGQDPDRAGQRTSTFLAYLSDASPATRRLAVLGLLGTPDGPGVEPALTAALATEPDGRIAQWLRLALLRL